MISFLLTLIIPAEQPLMSGASLSYANMIFFCCMGGHRPTICLVFLVNDIMKNNEVLFVSSFLNNVTKCFTRKDKVS